MNNWNQVSLQEVCKITRGASPRPIKDWIAEDLKGIPWVKISDATASKTRFIKHTSERIKQEGISKSVSVVPGDLIVSNSATPGLPKFMDINACIHDGWLLIREFEGIDKEFLYYLLINDRKYLVSQGTGTVFTNLKTDILKNHIIQLPTINVQKTIASFLSKLDSKIELNQKMNENLEEIAKTLFKSWFIDFDPVRAKAEGRPTGLSKEISDLFPGSFEDSELGEIPKGWNLLTFGDFVTPVRGKVITKKTTNPGDIPVVAGGLEPAYFHSIANVEGPAVTISASGANAGYTNLYYEDIWASDCSYISNKQSSNVFTSYIFLKLNQGRIFDSQHGAAQPHIYPDDLRRLDMFIPSNDLYETFENLITSFFNKIKLNIEETKNLISLRDTLLPKLISGELKIPDAEEIIEEARV